MVETYDRYMDTLLTVITYIGDVTYSYCCIYTHEDK